MGKKNLRKIHEDHLDMFHWTLKFEKLIIIQFPKKKLIKLKLRKFQLQVPMLSAIPYILMVQMIY